MKIPEKIIEERSRWLIDSDSEYYFYRGKLAAIKAISEYIKNGGGSSRYLAYDCIGVAYADALDYGLMHISNFVGDRILKDEPQILICDAVKLLEEK